MICCQSKYPIDNNPHPQNIIFLPLIFKQKFTLFFFIILNLKKPPTGFSKKIEVITTTFSPPDTSLHCLTFTLIVDCSKHISSLLNKGRNQINFFHLKKNYIYLLSVPASSCVSVFQVCFFLQHHMGI